MITVELQGRLGNQMFQYAICRTIAERNGYNYFISSKKNNHGQNISEYFNLDMGVVDGNIINSIGEDIFVQKYDPRLFNIPDYTSLHGFFQSEKYFSENLNKVREWFKVKEHPTTNDILEQYPIDKYCYIHFRGTDYEEWDGGNIILPLSYYDKSIDLVSKIFPDIKFLVITDDRNLASKYFSKYPIISNDIIIDFELLYNSNQCIISNSTFSWWASWLGEKKITVGPKFWINYNRPERGWYPIDIETKKFIYV